MEEVELLPQQRNDVIPEAKLSTFPRRRDTKTRQVVTISYA
jgi:hypothetical protein